MARYLVRHPGKQRDDILVEDPALTLHFENGWAVFTDEAGICLAIPTEAGAHIERVDEPIGTAPQKE
ncbi:hypothetical protein PV405_08805 [Streptomyces sp. ME02-6979-3A]|uniref:hypothetical protein n=1 Tax=Streptomyces sp. ME02-6979-3A TaxID=3028673 RepID=UPI0029B973AD|nr:hypothetical protein [Streptomyces sp. ME02-6979-3A]MDX3324766.1 hypothetical protein [Streptomyces sp. ME02-6979-3A]